MSDEDGEGRSTTAKATSSTTTIITSATSSTPSSTSVSSSAAISESHHDQQPEEPTTCSSARVFSKVPIFIVEDHHDVLTFLYRCIGSRHLPLGGNTIIHFDSHPDMCIPKHMPAGYVFNKEDLLDSISIENWMMPTVFAGHVERIVWIKPDWANQMPKGKFQFHVGEYEGSIRTDSTLEYFVSEGCYQPEEQLENKKSLTLQVCAIEEYKVADDDGLKDGYILDIDLDYFSTHNPFLKIYEKVGLYDKLKEVFISPELADTTENDLAKLQRVAKDREEKLEFLESMFLYLEEVGNLKHFLVDYQQEISEEYSQLLEKVSSLVAVLKKEYAEDEIDWSMIYDAGCTCDVTDLPHHESTREEIQTLVQQLESFLARLPAPPTVITMSRSSEDDYTPAHQVEQIQELVMGALKKCLRTELDQPIMYYKDQEFKL